MNINTEKLKQLAGLLEKEFEGAEDQAKYKIIIPFLEAFGHPEDLQLEFRTGQNAGDIKIRNLPSDSTVIVECKASDVNLDDYIDQLKTYSYDDDPNPRIAILSNGNEFRFYGPRLDASNFNKKLFFSFKKEELANEDIISKIASILHRDVLTSGQANEKILTFFKELKEKEEFESIEKERLRKELNELEVKIKEVNEQRQRLLDRESEIKDLLGAESKGIKESQDVKIICDEDSLQKYQNIMVSLSGILEKKYGKWASNLTIKRIRWSPKFKKYSSKDKSWISVNAYWKWGNSLGINYGVQPKTQEREDIFFFWIGVDTKNPELILKFREDKIQAMLKQNGFQLDPEHDYGIAYKKVIEMNDKFSFEEHQKKSIEEIDKIKPIIEELTKEE